MKIKQGVSFLDVKWDNEPMIVDNDSKSKSSQWLLLSMMLAKRLILQLLKLLAPWLILTSKLFLKLMGNQTVKLSQRRLKNCIGFDVNVKMCIYL